MGLMSWMMEKGALGGIARSAAKIYNKCVRDEPNQHITTYLANVAVMRYVSVGQLHNVTLSLKSVRRMAVDGNRPVGLLSLCFAFAKLEMDVEGIEHSVSEVLQKVLVKEGFSTNEINGTRDPNQFSEHFLEMMDFEQSMRNDT